MNEEGLREFLDALGGTVVAKKDPDGVMLHCLEGECKFACVTPFAMYMHRKQDHFPAY